MAGFHIPETISRNSAQQAQAPCLRLGSDRRFDWHGRRFLRHGHLPAAAFP